MPLSPACDQGKPSLFATLRRRRTPARQTSSHNHAGLQRGAPDTVGPGPSCQTSRVTGGLGCAASRARWVRVHGTHARKSCAPRVRSRTWRRNACGRHAGWRVIGDDTMGPGPSCQWFASGLGWPAGQPLCMTAIAPQGCDGATRRRRRHKVATAQRDDGDATRLRRRHEAATALRGVGEL
jgi:hypothetical protein